MWIEVTSVLKLRTIKHDFYTKKNHINKYWDLMGKNYIKMIWTHLNKYHFYSHFVSFSFYPCITTMSKQIDVFLKDVEENILLYVA